MHSSLIFDDCGSDQLTDGIDVLNDSTGDLSDGHLLKNLSTKIVSMQPKLFLGNKVNEIVLFLGGCSRKSTVTLPPDGVDLDAI